MPGDLSLFGDDEPTSAAPAQHEPASIADWQVELIRKALDGQGWTSMSDRQAAVVQAAGREVESLRALTHDEAIRVLARLGEIGRTRAARSLWEQREDDTWIDRL
ncbi:MAG TPA: hypothetical protein VGE38_11230 [Nocardioides sp.]|uniref:hypothetical protein n=1 Tax=Nocardioides sp. TaxID=35761 RepID=UPI002EDB89D0